MSALLQAKYNGREELVPVLREAVGDVDFFEACALGDVERVGELLDRDPTLVRATAPDGFFGLSLAAFFGQPQVVRVLIDRGADVNRRAEHEHVRVMPLHAAAAGNDTAIVRMLLDTGADVDVTQPGGFTALMSAAQNGNAEMVELLLERGADASRTTDDGRTATTIAREAGHLPLAEHLATAGTGAVSDAATEDARGVADFVTASDPMRSPWPGPRALSESAVSDG